MRVAESVPGETFLTFFVSGTLATRRRFGKVLLARIKRGGRRKATTFVFSG